MNGGKRQRWRPRRRRAYVLFIERPIIESKARNTFACLNSFEWLDTKMRPHPATRGTLQYKIIQIQLLHFISEYPTTKRFANRILKATKKNQFIAINQKERKTSEKKIQTCLVQLELKYFVCTRKKYRYIWTRTRNKSF